MYRIGKREKSKRRRAVKWLGIAIIVLLMLGLLVSTIINALKPKTVITQSKAITTHVNYSSQTKHYDEGDFSINLPATWHSVPRPVGPYKSFIWQSDNKITNGQVIEIFEDTIPANFAVNKVFIVAGENDHLILKGSVSDNCDQYTLDQKVPLNQDGIPAEWQGVNFLCDKANNERDVVGTSSTDGINTVIVKGPVARTHKFFFTYTDYSVNPDYTFFSNTLSSIKMN